MGALQVSQHSFYIPVMGTGFTIDTPLAVAKYGITSVVSLVDDVLIEQMREYWCRKTQRAYQPIGQNEPDRRARRITAYLNLLAEVVDEQFKELLGQPLLAGSDLDRYFTLLPTESPTSGLYALLKRTADVTERQKIERQLREMIKPGQIEVNIMTKLDVPQWKDDQQLPYMYHDAASALRGFALSKLRSSMVFSAGFNGTLYNYLTEFNDFYPDEEGNLNKKICLKVSDYRSALIQGKYLAKRGIWVSEYRIESPLNCGGHAFINDGSLMGPILEEFSRGREELAKELFAIYQAALLKRRGVKLGAPLHFRVTAQGGVGTAEEHRFLRERYHLDAVGWGSPFLLVPEVVKLDEDTLNKLASAKGEEITLSRSSPIGIPFWTLVDSGSNIHRCELIAAGTPGSLCPKGYTRTSVDENGRPICQASRVYQQKKIAELDVMNLPEEIKELRRQEILAKACICHELGGSVLLKCQIVKRAYPAVCPGPNLRYFSKVCTLEQMVGHIYGRENLLEGVQRDNLFLNELALQIKALEEDLQRNRLGLTGRDVAELTSAAQTILTGIDYYLQLADSLPEAMQQHGDFVAKLSLAKEELAKILARAADIAPQTASV